VVRRNVPLVDQVVLEIVSQIDAGTIVRDGGLLPSEVDLSQQFDVSRATVREALGKLELAGIILRRQGVGTFVNGFMGKEPIWLQDWFAQARGFTDALRQSGRTAGCCILQTNVGPAGPLGGHLQVASDALLLSIEKVITTDDRPLIHSYNAVPVALLPEELRGQARELGWQAESTYRFLQAYCRTTVHHQQSEVRAVAATADLAALLVVQSGAPLLRVAEVAYNQELMPVFYGLNHYRGDMVSFRQMRRPAMTIGHDSIV
jgi:GntR family transcriptional regulator